MHTIDQVIQQLGGLGAFAAAIGVKLSTASQMRRRGSIPVRYWPRLVAATEAARGKTNMTMSYDMLVAMHARERGGRPCR